MASIKDVKEKAQQYVVKGKYDKAVQLYTKIIEKLQEKGNPDISLYNRVGDIYLDKLNNKELAVENYITAMTMYGKFGLFPNAIAMAKKVLKIDNTLIEMYEKIGEFNKKQGLIGEALNNFILYAEKSIQKNDRKSAIKAFKETLDMMPERIEIKEKLVDLYIQEEQYDQAVELLKEAESHYVKMNSMEQAAVIRQKITKYAKQTANPEPEAVKLETPPEPQQKHDEIEMDDFDMNDLVDDLTKELDSTFQTTASPDVSDVDSRVSPDIAPGLGSSSIESPFAEPAKTEQFDLSSLSPAEESVDLGSPDVMPNAFNFEDFVELAKLQEELDINEAVQSYYQGADGYLSAGDLKNAMRVYSRIVKIKSNENKAHQAIIDIAYKTGNHSSALYSMLYTAKQLMATNVQQSSKLIDQILSIDPANSEAIELKNKINPPKPEAQPAAQNNPVKNEFEEMTADDFLSEFKSEISDGLEGNELFAEAEHMTAKDIVSGKNEGNKPKFKIENDQPAGGDDVWSLNELLDELKEGVNESIPEDDVSSHYDLGVSFKEMGLYDMAVEELGKALKSKEFEMRSLEMLSQCHLEKGEIDKAENTLIKALSIKDKDPREYLGIKNTLAILYEQKKMFSEARKLLNEIRKIDPGFKGIDKHLSMLEEAISNQKKAEKSNQSQDSFVDFSELLKDDSGGDDMGDFEDIEIDLDDEDEDNKTKNISYM